MSPTVEHEPATLTPQGTGTRNSSRNLSLWAAVTTGILAIPFVAMFFTREVQWTAFDFAFAGVVIFGLGALYEAAARRARGHRVYRWAAGLTLFTLFLTIWSQGAVGIIGSENDDIGLFFLGVVVAVIGTGLVSRFAARGMSVGLFGVAGAQALLAIGCIITGYDMLGSSLALVMAGMWAAAATLFRKAAASQPH